MGKTWIILIAIVLFLLVTFLYWRMTSDYAKKIYGKKMWKQWGTRTFYWHGVLFVSGGLTVMIIFILKWGTNLTF